SAKSAAICSVSRPARARRSARIFNLRRCARTNCSATGHRLGNLPAPALVFTQHSLGEQRALRRSVVARVCLYRLRDEPPVDVVPQPRRHRVPPPERGQGELAVILVACATGLVAEPIARGDRVSRHRTLLAAACRRPAHSVASSLAIHSLAIRTSAEQPSSQTGSPSAIRSTWRPWQDTPALPPCRDFSRSRRHSSPPRSWSTRW